MLFDTGSSWAASLTLAPTHATGRAEQAPRVPGATPSTPAGTRGCYSGPMSNLGQVLLTAPATVMGVFVVAAIFQPEGLPRTTPAAPEVATTESPSPKPSATPSPSPRLPQSPVEPAPIAAIDTVDPAVALIDSSLPLGVAAIDSADPSVAAIDTTNPTGVAAIDTTGVAVIDSTDPGGIAVIDSELPPLGELPDDLPGPLPELPDLDDE